MGFYREPMNVNEAIQKVIDHTTLRLPAKTVSLEHAYGRILKEPIKAKHDVPPFNRSAYDGYALRAEDTNDATTSNQIIIKVIGTIGAGHVPERPLQKNEAYRIMTGAILPNDANAVVMLEHTEEMTDGFALKRPVKMGDCLSFQGEDAKEGDQLIPTGTMIHPGTVALLATFGYAEVKVANAPKVSVIATGTELLSVSEPLQPGKIRNSNGPMIQAQLKRLGIKANMLGIMADDLDRATALVEKALQKSDVVITTGGVSVGDFDYIPAIYERLGAKVLFNKVKMRPGSVTTVAQLGDQMLFGLSGNPSACFIGFELFARPSILTMMGGSSPYLPYMKATLGEDFPQKNNFAKFIRAVWNMTDRGPVVVSAGFNASSAVSSIARGNCLIAFPSESEGYAKGAEVTILLLGGEQGVGTWEVRL